ncbi:hypothetical protein POM88_011466 [Heracleum sosnowskyi]|uniref:Uncharacterized protein n=1 Tax=Heracleum sosnowskyi TaxID=360622 RepID=A0AAD8IYD9_9APIA|nr:hypothetical protein POM88_011466 [Heracleum sosnowskyi]
MSSHSADLFQRLFRQDLLVVSLLQNFLLAKRIMRSANCSPISHLMFPATYQHHMWLAGVALLALVVSYWWPGFPANLSTEAYNEQYQEDQWALRVSHYAPWLMYWWNTQKLFQSCGVASGRSKFSHQDYEIFSKLVAIGKQKDRVLYHLILPFHFLCKNYSVTSLFTYLEIDVANSLKYSFFLLMKSFSLLSLTNLYLYYTFNQ